MIMKWMYKYSYSLILILMAMPKTGLFPMQLSLVMISTNDKKYLQVCEIFYNIAENQIMYEAETIYTMLTGKPKRAKM